ncbi:MAG: hypothetical protein JXQ90_05465 [Cyclobacteriaceae bacterium]
MKLQLLALLCLLTVGTLSAQEIGEVKDSRDDQTYKTITFTIPLEGGVSVKRTWMLENANYETEEGSTCYTDEPAYCEKFGRLYTFEAAMAACPEGYRIPTRKDWFLLFSQYSGYTKAGKALMENGDSGLDLLLGGSGTEFGYYTSVGKEGNYWDSADQGERPDGIVTLSAGREAVALGGIGKKFYNSCRCIKTH